MSAAGADRLEPVYAATRTVLRSGFLVSAALLVLGMVVAAARGEDVPSQVDPLPDVIPTVLDGHAAGFIDLAILAMMATPVAATVAVAIGFARAGDRRFAALSLATLGILGVSIALALV
jgi:uncharacterized membrane protein